MSLAEVDAEIISADLVAPPDAGRRIAERIEAARRSVERTRRATRCLLALATGLTLCGVATWADYRWELAWVQRAIALAAVGVATVVFARRGLPQWTGAYRLEDAAAAVERRLEQFGQRLRTTIDYQREVSRPARADAKLLRALEDDTYALSEHADFRVVVDNRPVLAGVAAVGALGLAWLTGLTINPEWRTATGRALLLPWQYTTVTFAPVEQTIKAGEDARVTAEVVGRGVTSAVVRYRPAGDDGEWTTVELSVPTEAEEATSEPVGEGDAASVPTLLHGKLEATLPDCQKDLEFEVLAGPLPLPTGRVRVLQPLTLQSVSATATPPAYVDKPAEKFDRWTFKVWEGSAVELAIELNRVPAEAKLTPVQAPTSKGDETAASKTLDSVSPLTIDGSTLRGRLDDLRASGTWELTAKAADGIELEPQRLTIRVQPDGRARVRFLTPAEELEVIPTAEVPFVVEASDDLALVRIGIAVRVKDGPLQTIWQQELPEGSTDVVRGEATLALEDYELTYQDGVTYYAFADDKYFDEERRTSTPLRFIDIRPFKMAYQVLDTGET